MIETAFDIALKYPLWGAFVSKCIKALFYRVGC